MASRSYCFTLFTQEKPKFNPECHRYLVYQLEKCPETGRYHWQGFCLLKKPMKIPGFQKSIHPTEKFHVERKDGTNEQARDYCMKEESRVEGPYEHGTFAAQGKRTDLEEACEIVKKHGMKRLAEEMPTMVVKYSRGFDRLRELLDTQVRDFKTEVTVLIGPPETGKSRYVAETESSLYWLPRSEKKTGWWDGYDAQDSVIIDDFYGWLSYDFMLRLLDRYPLQVEVKGGMRQFRSKRIYITSNKSIEEWYPNVKDKTALLRRIEFVFVNEVPPVLLSPPAEGASSVSE